jgi:hypothetical protein
MQLLPQCGDSIPWQQTLVSTDVPMNLMSASEQLRNETIKIYRATMLPVLYELETWSLKLREENRLRMFDSQVLSEMFWAKRDEVTGNCTKLHREELYLSSNVIR